ncbi:SDR family NAD(P)-dependent oxidoreductase [Demequina globuliformis]|uniref:SDR family NAD(P)-dependent oxidoreductase n=1 Tax=Demequina globuliformis TaxID=676202 RepID=UPI0007867D49|nr:SDR family NAD(P)-dependent oxidoreductase [Demequina globuliformis]
MATWFISGCSTGIGRATAHTAAAAGHRVFATARQPETLSGLAEEYPELVVPLALDVTDPASIRYAVTQAVGTGPIDVVVNNAGIGYFSTIEESDPQEARRVMDTNFWGSADLTTALLPHMREHRQGHIITISSIAGVRGSAGMGYYCASKWAISGFMESLAKEVAHLGIKVTLVEPGPVLSQWIPSGAKVRDIHPDYAEVMEPYWERIDALPGNQPGDPHALARALLQVAAHDAPPLHLLAGRHAIVQGAAKAAGLAEEIRQWEQLGLSIDTRA